MLETKLSKLSYYTSVIRGQTFNNNTKYGRDSLWEKVMGVKSNIKRRRKNIRLSKKNVTIIIVVVKASVAAIRARVNVSFVAVVVGSK
jgi:hypothetical protein